MINTIINIIRDLNEGFVLPDQDDRQTQVDLYSQIAKLFIDEMDYKYYFFADLILETDNNGKTNLDQIEEATIHNSEAFLTTEAPDPSSSYLILVMKVDKIEESIYPKIIELEENEFFFKKYVFYYTEEELNAFTEWYSKMKSSRKASIKQLLNEISEPNVDFDCLHISFFVRLLIKIPFLKLDFPKAVLKDFSEVVNSKISSTRGDRGNRIQELNQFMFNMVDMESDSADAISDILYKKFMEE